MFYIKSTDYTTLRKFKTRKHASNYKYPTSPLRKNNIAPGTHSGSSSITGFITN